MQIQNAGLRFAEYTGCKKSASAHHRTTLSGCIFANKASVDNRKKNLVNSNISSTRPLTIWWTSAHSWDRLVECGAPHQISTGFEFWFRYCTSGGQPNCTIFGGFLGWYTIYTFWGLLPPNGILPGAKLTLRPSLYWQCYCTTFEQWASAEHCCVGQGNSAGWLSHGIVPCHIIHFNYYFDRLSQRMAEKV